MTPKPSSRTFPSFICLLESSSRHTDPVSEQMMALSSDTGSAQQKVASSIEPSRMFLPDNGFWACGGATAGGASLENRCLVGEVSGPSSTLQTLTWRRPSVTRLFPIHTIPLTNEVHLFC